MVSASLSVASLLALATAAASADVPAYVVPAVDFTQIYSSAHGLLDAMQHDGIVSLKNIPSYATLRAEYLRKAAECAVHAKSHGAEFLLHRRLQDGTQRYTISTESGRRLDASGFETVESCPGYQEVYHKFSRVVENAVATVGRALDASQALQVARRQLQKAPTRMTARELLAESVHLDHFHAYEAARSLSTAAAKSVDDLSLEMHTDNGLMIAMTAPEYFDVADSGAVASRNTRSEDAGLLIQTAEGKTVRPLLQADELVLMLGEGINTWIHTTPRLHAVTHGMQYPRGLSYADSDASHKTLRAWFGKMVLLSEDHVMANTGVTYGEFANQTTRYLKDAANHRGFAAVACSPNRRLQASDNKCTVRTNCKLKASGVATEVPDTCAITCNHKATADQTNCAKNCECDDDTSVDGSTCWMLCVPLLSTSECDGEQKCNTAYKKEEIALVCAAGATTPTPTPTTAAPTTAPPTTAAPVATTPRPTTAKPTPTPSPASQSSGSASATDTSYASNAAVSPADTSLDVNDGSSDDSAVGSLESVADVPVAKKNTTNTTSPTPTTTKSGAASAGSIVGSVAMACAAALVSSMMI